MANSIKITRGLDIKINGNPTEKITKIPHSEVIEINPDYFHGIIPKMLVKGGEKIKAGDPVFYSKNFPEMMFVSPVSGTIEAVNRGDRRKVLNVSIKADAKTDYVKFNNTELTSENVKALLLKSGLWCFIKQRPYDVIANPDKKPKAIFISCFDSAPLAPDYEFIAKDQLADFQKGIDALTKLTDGKVYLGVKSSNSIFNKVKNVEVNIFQGPHPAGNVGVQINKINPVNKGETVWTVNAQDIIIIGRLFGKGIVDFTKIVALTGPEVANPQYFETLAGNNIGQIIKGNIKNVNYPLRYISGNVLTGIKISENSFISPYHDQISVIDEGTEIHELFGWAMPRLNKFSSTRLFFTRLFPHKNYKFDARLLGGRRGIIMSNEYDKVFPMDIYPEFLIKAMMAKNVDKMENLGAYEVAPEDFALAEFVDTSKLPLQAIVREALDYMKGELE
ncbi:Na(+)-translocating NADH-quinone reductase subunit A [uncultured Paludibacter sp.]|nr:Na(+)-translocating NADH-quinone reductase subunit A [uncultured Paludibacter sp.]